MSVKVENYHSERQRWAWKVSWKPRRGKCRSGRSLAGRQHGHAAGPWPLAPGAWTLDLLIYCDVLKWAPVWKVSNFIIVSMLEIISTVVFCYWKINFLNSSFHPWCLVHTSGPQISQSCSPLYLPVLVWAFPITTSLGAQGNRIPYTMQVSFVSYYTQRVV